MVLPSVHTIINFATEFFEMFTKKQSEHPQIVFQVFQVFRVFQVFHFAFGPQNRPILVQIGTNPKNRYPPAPAISWLRETPKKAIHPPAGVATHDAIRQAIGAVFFRRSRLFLREAAFFSGGEGCEWRAKRATVGESGDKTENAFSGLIPLAVPRKGESPHIPAPRLFILFHPTKPHPSKAPSHQTHHTTINQNEFVKWGQSQRISSPFFTHLLPRSFAFLPNYLYFCPIKRPMR